MPEIGEWHSQPERIFQGMARSLIQKERALQPQHPPRASTGPTPATQDSAPHGGPLGATSATHHLLEPGPALFSPCALSWPRDARPEQPEPLGWVPSLRGAPVKGCPPHPGSQKTRSTPRLQCSHPLNVGRCFFSSIF